MNTGDRITISGVFTAFTDGHMLIVRTNELPFAKKPQKFLSVEEAGFYSNGPLYESTTEIKVDMSDEVFFAFVEPKKLSTSKKIVTIVGALADMQSRGIAQLGIVAEKIITRGEISDEAFFKYLIGQPGTAEDHWISAEKELLSK